MAVFIIGKTSVLVLSENTDSAPRVVHMAELSFQNGPNEKNVLAD